MEDEHSLDQTIRDENTWTSLPVLTIGSLDRIGDREYREQCALRLFEVLLDLDLCLGDIRVDAQTGELLCTREQLRLLKGAADGVLQALDSTP